MPKQRCEGRCGSWKQQSDCVNVSEAANKPPALARATWVCRRCWREAQAEAKEAAARRPATRSHQPPVLTQRQPPKAKAQALQEEAEAAVGPLPDSKRQRLERTGSGAAAAPTSAAEQAELAQPCPHQQQQQPSQQQQPIAAAEASPPLSAPGDAAGAAAGGCSPRAAPPLRSAAAGQLPPLARQSEQAARQPLVPPEALPFSPLWQLGRQQEPAVHQPPAPPDAPPCPPQRQQRQQQAPAPPWSPQGQQPVAQQAAAQQRPVPPSQQHQPGDAALDSPRIPGVRRWKDGGYEGYLHSSGRHSLGTWDSPLAAAQAVVHSHAAEIAGLVGGCPAFPHQVPGGVWQHLQDRTVSLAHTAVAARRLFAGGGSSSPAGRRSRSQWGLSPEEQQLLDSIKSSKRPDASLPPAEVLDGYRLLKRIALAQAQRIAQLQAEVARQQTEHDFAAARQRGSHAAAAAHASQAAAAAAVTAKAGTLLAAEAQLEAAGKPGVLLRLAQAVQQGMLLPDSAACAYLHDWSRKLVLGSRARWSSQLKAVALYAAAQRCGYSALQVFTDAGLPMPSKSTLCRHRHALDPDPTFTQGFSQGRLAALLSRNPDARLAFAALDSTDISPAMRFERQPCGRYRLVGASDFCDLVAGADDELREAEAAFNQQFLPLEALMAVECLTPSQEQQLELTLAATQRWLSILLSRLDAQLAEAQATYNVMLARYSSRAGGGRLYPRQQNMLARQQQVVRELESSRSQAEQLLAALAACVGQRPQPYSVTLHPAGDEVRLQLTPPQPGHEAAVGKWGDALVAAGCSAHQQLPRLHAAGLLAATSLLAVVLTVHDCTDREVVGQIMLGRKLAGDALPAILRSLAALVERTSGGRVQLASIATDGEHLRALLPSLSGSGRPTTLPEVAKQTTAAVSQRLAAADSHMAGGPGTYKRKLAVVFAEFCQVLQPCHGDKHDYGAKTALPVRSDEILIVHASGQDRLAAAELFEAAAVKAATAARAVAAAAAARSAAAAAVGQPGRRRVGTEFVTEQRVERPCWGGVKVQDPPACRACSPCKAGEQCALQAAWQSMAPPGSQQAALFAQRLAEAKEAGCPPRQLSRVQTSAAKCRLVEVQVERAVYAPTSPAATAADAPVAMEVEYSHAADGPAPMAIDAAGEGLPQQPQPAAAALGSHQEREQQQQAAAAAGGSQQQPQQAGGPLLASDMHGPRVFSSQAYTVELRVMRQAVPHQRVVDPLGQLAAEVWACEDPRQDQPVPISCQQAWAQGQAGPASFEELLRFAVSAPRSQGAEALWRQYGPAPPPAAALIARLPPGLRDDPAFAQGGFASLQSTAAQLAPPCSPAQQRRLYTMFLCCHVPSLLGLSEQRALSIALSALQQECLEQRRAQLRSGGLDFSSQFYQPDGMAIHLDVNHKVRNAVQGIARQRSAAGSSADEDNGGGEGSSEGSQPGEEQAARRLLPQGVLEQLLRQLDSRYQRMPVVQQRQQPVKPRTLLAAVMGACDKQHTATAQALFGSMQLARAAAASGQWELAAVLATICRGATYDMPGLTTDARTLALADQAAMFSCLLGSRPFQAQPLPRSIDGFSTECAISLLVNEASRLHVMGQLLPAQRSAACDQAYTTDPCELLFAVLCMLCGYKPPPSQLAAVQRSIQCAARLKALPEAERGFHISERAKQWYPGSSQQPRAASWNDGSALADGGVAALRARQAKNGYKADKATKPDKPLSLRELGGYKLGSTLLD